MESDNPGAPGSKTLTNKNLLKGYNYNFKVLDPSNVKVEISESDVTDYRPPLDDYMDRGFNESELLKKDIKLLNSLEPELLDICQRLGKKIANKRVRRRKQAKNMRPDIRKTLRKNLKYGNTLLEMLRPSPGLRRADTFS